MQPEQPPNSSSDHSNVLLPPESFVCNEALRTIYARYRNALNEKLPYVPVTPVLNVILECVVAAQRYADAVEAVAKAGLDNEAFGMLRVSTENITNLLYILYAGPATTSSTRDDLANQYTQYGHIVKQKMIEKSPELAREIYRRRGKTDTEIAQEEAKVKHEADTARTQFGFYSNPVGKRGYSPSWTPGLTFEARLQAVVAHLPAFAGPPDLWDLILDSVTSLNARIHPGSFGARSYWIEAQGGRELKDQRVISTCRADTATLQAYWAWCCLAELFGELPLIKALWNQEVNDKGNAAIAEMNAKQSKHE